ncbi:MAG: BrnT family toxin [Spirochaetaceae bacterium]|jgi:uncharacterized DUF497 family protein|nr:BrnT family toxin [Spirochaetaceae bacterium]
MDGIKFILDHDKKHKIPYHFFRESKMVFNDPNAKIIYAPDHSKEEDRFIIFGLSKALNLLIVCHCYKEKEEQIRIFSARNITANEKKQYGGN